MLKYNIYIIVLMLAGCTQYKWVKTGQNDHQMQRELLSCQAKSLRELPPDNQVSDTGLTRNYSSGKKSRHDRYRENRDYHQQEYSHYVDTNGELRETLTDDCMYSRGWERIILQN